MQDVERSEKALLSFLESSGFIPLLAKATVTYIKPVFTQTSHRGKKLHVSFAKSILKVCV